LKNRFKGRRQTMSRVTGGLPDDVRNDVADSQDYQSDEELTEDELDDVSGGDDGWGTGTPPPPPEGDP
jgi:hypothetical protein